MREGDTLGPYRILGKLGAGGMGEVYRATDTNLKRQVALKVLPEAVAADADRLARFQREAEVLAALNHPHIAAIYGLERTDTQTALVMELVEGPTLADRIAEGRIPVDEALAIARQIAEALEAAHEQGIVHRDLKPANIKATPDGPVKVLDFGLAKAMEPAAALRASAGQTRSMSPTITTPAMTQAGMILGTAAYMSPEQARGKPVDRRADIWAFGAVLYEMLTGQRAFEDEDISLTLSRVLRMDPAFDALPADVPASVTQALRVCLRKDLRQRASDIHDVRLALEGAFSPPQGGGDAHQIVAASRRGLPAPVAVALAVLAAVVAGVAGWMARPVPTRFGSEVIRLSIPLSPDERLADESAGRWPPLTLSPDGTRIAYASGGRLFIRDLARFDAREAAGSDGATSPFFSPDGQWVGFFAQGQLKKVSVAGGSAEPLADAPRAAGGSWAGDGRIYFAPSNATGLSRVSEDGGAVESVTRDIWLLDLVRFTLQQLPNRAGSSQFPVYSSDGSSLFYRGTRAGFRNLYRAPVDGSGMEERLTSGEGSDTARSASRDGRWLAFDNVSPSSGLDIWMLPLQGGSDMRPYLNTTANEGDARFSPDGRWLAYGSTSPPGGVYVKPFEGPGGGVLVAPNGLSPLWSPDGREISRCWSWPSRMSGCCSPLPRTIGERLSIDDGEHKVAHPAVTRPAGDARRNRLL